MIFFMLYLFGPYARTNKPLSLPAAQAGAARLTEIALTALLRMSEQAPLYIFTAFICAYAVGTLHMSRDLILTAVLVASCVS
jgi:hypothetical protein